MNRNARTLVVVLVALIVAGIATLGVYRAIKRLPVREVEVAHTYVLVADRPIAIGVRLSEADVKLVPWPSRTPLQGAHAKPEEVVNRGVIAPVLENEPITEAKLAPLEAGAGLPPTIPPGMRAISVRVNEVIGVAGFVVPGARVDLLVTLKRDNESVTRVVVSNVQVLTAGTRYDQEKAKAGEAMPSTVVTVLLTPADAERTVLATAEGQLMLALRNPLDAAPTSTPGTHTASLFGSERREPPQAPARPKPVAVVAPAVPAAAPAPAVPAAAPAPYVVEAIRAAKRSHEQVQSE
jgi:pilus assembly protein CpaB